MKLASVERNGKVRTAVMLSEHAGIDLNEADQNIPATMIELLEAGESVLDRVRATLDTGARARFSLEEPTVKLMAPVPRPGKVLAIGLNYRDHAEESQQTIPTHPVVFMKPPGCIVGPGESIVVPSVSRAVDWEAELCFVIGRRAWHVSAKDALSHVAGYMNGNDVSVRDWQFHAPTWTMGKGFDTHGPTGPWIVTLDETGDGNDLAVHCYVNGQEKQSSNTKHLIFDVPTLIEYLSTAMTLEPGDIVFTGTPAGVGAPTKTWLAPGDSVVVEIGNLGRLENPVAAESASARMKGDPS